MFADAAESEPLTAKLETLLRYAREFIDSPRGQQLVATAKKNPKAAMAAAVGGLMLVKRILSSRR